MTGMPGGRPTLRTPEVEAKILDGLAAGCFLSDVCAHDDMPSPRTVYGWTDADPEFSRAVARARKAGAGDFVAAGMRGLDECDGDSASQVTKAIGRANYRKWLASCFDRATFGDKQGVEVSGPDGGPVQVQNLADLLRLASTPDDPGAGR